jgi:hypothetical protein
MKKNLIQQIDSLEKDILGSQPFLIDFNQIREYDLFIRKLKHIKAIAIKDPRFPYQSIQNQIDDLLRRDKTIKIFTVKLRLEGLIDNKILKPIVNGE